MEWRIGCSGYRYPEWTRVFYPEDLVKERWLAYYSRFFNTVELNATYYRSLSGNVLKRLYNETPSDFLFTVKAPASIMRARRFTEAQRIAGDFSDSMRDCLGDKLGAILFQTSGEYAYEHERLLRLIELLDPGIQNVVEFRHPSWWNLEVFSVLERAGVAFCGMSHPDLPSSVVRTTDTIYYRLHGVPSLYNSVYPTNVLEELVQDISLRSGSRRAFVYFNNPANGHAVVNARRLQEISALAHQTSR